MSAKSTQRVTRKHAISIITEELEYIGNDVLADILDLLADSKQSRLMSSLDNFIVSNFVDNE